MEEKPVANNPIQQPNIPTPQEPKHGSFLTNKLFLITLVIVILFTIIYAGIYLNLNSQLNQITKSNPTPTITHQRSPTPTIDPTANWKTYANSKFHFQLKYPPKYKITEGNEVIDLSEENACCDSDFQIFLDESNFDDYQTLLRCEKAMEEIKINPSSPRSNCLEDGQKHGQNTDITTIRLGSLEAISFYVGDTGVGGLHRIIQTHKEPRIEIRYPCCGVKSTNDQILSTFKFTLASPIGGDQEDQVVCTQDAKQCPDGSYVSRQPPNCEFAACP